MGGGPSVVRRAAFEKSNAELIASLRGNFVAAQQTIFMDGQSSLVPPHQTWTEQADSILFVPKLNFTYSSLAEERSQYDITVKLFYLPDIPLAQRRTHAKEAIDLVLKELHVSSIDLLIVSFPGIAFDADDEEDEDLSDGVASGDSSAESGPSDEEIDTMIETWRTLEKLQGDGIINKLGLSEFGTQRLSKFLPKTKVRPSVDQINVRDCCVVPKSLILYAKQEKIELLTHNDCTNILPRGTLRELLGPGEKGSGVLASSGQAGGLQGEVEPQWVVKYTAVVKNRGVVENKGYFAVAKLFDEQE
ncbi:MAG: hypothetical protein M1820_004165 [Bogoriella megaspora]|nr:MAG: hypothetical protein M1820_004165 [Bogoriella megaspora]